MGEWGELGGSGRFTWGGRDASDFRSRNATAATDFWLIGINAVINNYAIIHDDINEEIELSQETIRRRLIAHFGYCYQRNLIHWLS